jgi:NTP pyrophosphatase (non-canonical NTP hydrolase)
VNIKEAQEMMRKIYLERDQARGIEGTLKRTIEEIEELREAIENNETTTSVADEIADVFAWLCSLANLLEIDVAGAFYKKYSDVCSKCKRSPCDCPADN